MRLTTSNLALGLAGLALFASAGGPAAAADAGGSAVRLLTGKQVRDNSLTGKDIRNGSLTAKDLAPGTLARGGAGAAGPTGPRGAAGAAGPVGPAGPAGADGAACPEGEPGERGLQGEPGPRGLTGVKGDKGDKGDAGAPAPVAESWRYIGNTGQPAFVKDQGFPGYEWTNSFESPWSPVAFYKDADNRVFIRGKVRCVGNTCGSASLIFMLPEGYRPTQRHTFVGWGTNADGSGSPVRLNVEPEGWVDRAPGTNNTGVSLDGISFRAG